MPNKKFKASDFEKDLEKTYNQAVKAGWEDVKTKICSKCGEEKPYSAFHRSRGSIGGFNSCCKECKLKKDKNIFRKSRNKRLNQMENYYKNNKAEYYKRTRELEIKYPEKRKGRVETLKALKNGQIQKEPCVFCGDKDTQAHHQDYSKPLDVEWMCLRCHRLFHSIIRQTIKEERAEAVREYKKNLKEQVGEYWYKFIK